MNNQGEVDYHVCPECGFLMTDDEYMSIIADVPCPGRGGEPCGTPISRFRARYKKQGLGDEHAVE